MLTNSGLQAFKDNIVFTFTAGRTVHVSELNSKELQELCDTMRKKGFPVTQRETLEYRLRRKIYALCFDAGIIYAGRLENEFCKSRCVLHGARSSEKRNQRTESKRIKKNAETIFCNSN